MKGKEEQLQITSKSEEQFSKPNPAREEQQFWCRLRLV
jgi:hypothetical protein